VKSLRKKEIFSTISEGHRSIREKSRGEKGAIKNDEKRGKYFPEEVRRLLPEKKNIMVLKTEGKASRKAETRRKKKKKTYYY